MSNNFPIIINVEPTNKDTYCPEFWNRTYINQRNDQLNVKPCCFYDPRIGAIPDRTSQFSDFQSVYQDYNSLPALVEMREKNLLGQTDPGCVYCHKSEEHGIKSGRQYSIEQHGTRQVEISSHLDLSLGNLCNLSCAICGPYNSSSWIPISNTIWGNNSFNKYVKQNRPVIDDPELFLSLKSIQLQGGEIFMEPNYLKFFQNMGKYRSYSDLSIRIFTNGTIKPDTEFWEILKSCGQVHLLFSIDDVGERFEYQRRGANWAKVVENINWFQENSGSNVMLGLNTTYSLYNVFYLAEIHETFTKLFPRLVKNFQPFNTGMANCSAGQMTANVRALILQKVSGIPELSFLRDYIQVSDENPYKGFLDYIKKYDAATGTSYATAHPEFYKLITE
jgi:hypothetical protein